MLLGSLQGDILQMGTNTPKRQLLSSFLPPKLFLERGGPLQSVPYSSIGMLVNPINATN